MSYYWNIQVKWKYYFDPMLLLNSPWRESLYFTMTHISLKSWKFFLQFKHMNFISKQYQGPYVKLRLFTTELKYHKHVIIPNWYFCCVLWRPICRGMPVWLLCDFIFKRCPLIKKAPHAYLWPRYQWQCLQYAVRMSFDFPLGLGKLCTAKGKLLHWHARI